MDWIAGIQNAINYIESNLDDEVKIEEAAKAAACSTFYFYKIFGILCGMTVGEYIRKRRMTLAGNEIISSDRKVIDIAIKYGYESPESFARAFFKFHGINPSEAKKDGSMLKSFSRLSVQFILNGGSIMNYKIVEKEAFEILEKAETQSLENDENLRTIPEFWARARQDGTLKTVVGNSKNDKFIYGVCYNSLKDNEKSFDYSIAAECCSGCAVPEGFRKNIIPKRTWAVFECRGRMPEAIQKLWQRIVSEFFPASAYVPTYEFDIEAYTEGDMSKDDYYSEIWVPVIKK